MASVPLLTVSLSCLLFGLFLYFKPAQAIKFQQKFYEKINWRMEPIDFKKEIRNTKWMGAFLIVFVIAALIYTAFIKT